MNANKLLIIVAATVAPIPCAIPAANEARAATPLTVVPPIVAVAPGADGIFSPQLSGPAGTATFSPGSLTSTAITVAPLGNGSYIPGFAHVTAVGGATEGYFATNGFLMADPETFAFRLLVGGADPTSGQIAQIVGDINRFTVPPAPASAVPQTDDAFLGGQYDLIFTAYPPFYGSGPNYVGFDFATETAVSGVTVTDVAAFSAVPEPANVAATLAALSSICLRSRLLRNRSRF